MNKIHATLVVVIMAGMIGTASAEIPEDVRIGYVFDSDWAEGVEGKELAEIAVDEFNEYLEVLNADWTFSISFEDAKSNGHLALEKIQAYNSAGVDLLLGVAYSSHINAAARYIDANELLVISHGSQAASLEIDDSIFRLVPSDGNQAPAINQMLSNAGIEVLITVVRGDVWGDGLVGNVKKDFNGTVYDGFRYNPEATEFSSEVSLLDDEIKKLIDEYGADKVGVLYVGTDEFLPIMQSLEPYENYSQVRWFSSNTQSQKQYFLEDPIASQFAEDTQFTATRSIPTTGNHIKDMIDAKYMEMYNATITSTYGYAAYDSVWLLGTAILQAQSADTNTLTEVIPHVASHMLGSSGSLELTESGDLATANFEVWQISDGAWVQVGTE